MVGNSPMCRLCISCTEKNISRLRTLWVSWEMPAWSQCPAEQQFLCNSSKGVSGKALAPVQIFK